MTRVKALLRHWLDVPSRAEHEALRRKASESALLWCLYGIERDAPDGNRYMAARADVDRALAAHGAMVPFTEEPAPVEPPPLDRSERLARVVLLLYAAALALGLAALLIGCTIRGGADCAGGCPPREVCAGGRCVPADLRPVPSMTGPL